MMHRRQRLTVCCVAVVVLSLAGAAAAQTTQPVAPRAPRYPLKTARGLFTDDQIKLARANVAEYPAAKNVADDIIKAADEWVAWDDAALTALLTWADVPRAFDVGTAGCPKCGHEIFQKHGNYGWIIDAKRPFKVKCPVDGSVYPTNDYGKYYHSGFKEKAGWDTPYVDDGWGWKDPKTGEKYWFVAYYDHWMWHKHLVPGIQNMARAYLLTGDKKYAHKAAVMLHRVAEVYPAMDHEPQSRYGQMMRERGAHYPGKVVNHIWETALARSLAEAYDLVWETIDSDAELQKSTGKSGEQIRAFIEANFLEDAIDAYYAGKIRGNFGMHQSTLTHLAIARQYGETDKWFDELLNRADANPQLLGLNVALYNLVFRDGVPNETGPGYNFLWVSKISEYGEILDRAGHDVFAIPKMRGLYDGVLDMVNLGRFTPDVGDSGSVWGGRTGADAATFQTAYRHFKDPRYARLLEELNATGDKTFKSFNALFYPAIEPPKGDDAPPAPRLLDGYGMAILNNPKDSVSASLYYGFKGGHGHFDRLNYQIYAGGQSIVPDLGYPDAMNAFVQGIFTWSKNTISHNTVTVDASRQAANVPGTVHLFAVSPFARVVDIDAAGTYPQTSVYRRALIMVDAGPDQSYFVDVFNVTGGKQHDYSLHGPPGEFEMLGGSWSEPARGTLAGEDIALEALYDDPKLAKTGEKVGFGTYQGSGFQHFTNVRRHQSGDWIAQYAHEKNPKSRVRLRVLPAPKQQLMLAEAKVSPVKFPQVLRYLIARTQGDKLSSRFVSIIEPYTQTPYIERIEQLDDGVLVYRAGGESDLVLYQPKQAVHGVSSDAQVAVVTFDAEKRPLRVFFAGGSKLTVGERTFDAPATVGGTIVSTDPDKSIIRVRTRGGDVDPASLVGRVVHFRNDYRRTAHPIIDARREGDELVLTTRDALRVGRLKVKAIKGQTITSDTAMPLDGVYRGVTLSDDTGAAGALVKSVGDGKINLARPLPSDLAIEPGDDVWLINVGPGDTLEVPPMLHWSANAAAATAPAGRSEISRGRSA